MEQVTVIDVNEEPGLYEIGVHSAVREITCNRLEVGQFFEEDRFPNLEKLSFTQRECVEVRVKSASLRVVDIKSAASIKLECPSLEELKCRGHDMKIFKLDAPILRDMVLTFGPLSYLELKCPLLESLDVSHNYLKVLILDSPCLRSVICKGNKIHWLEIKSRELRFLNCFDNRLVGLRLDAPQLEHLDCVGNDMYFLNLTPDRSDDIQLPLLKVLKFSIVTERALKVECPMLEKLRCCRGKLTKLELLCPSLKSLKCRFNRLTHIDWSRCPMLEIVWCSENKLQDLNGLEYCGSLKTLWCAENLRRAAKLLKQHLPDLEVQMYDVGGADV